MFGYHDSNRCAFDLWSPVTAHQYDEQADSNQQGYGVWEDTPYHTAVENHAFSAYAYHTQRLIDIADAIGQGRRTDISVSDDFTSDDLRYIEQVLLDKYGLVANLTLES